MLQYINFNTSKCTFGRFGWTLLEGCTFTQAAATARQVFEELNVEDCSIEALFGLSLLQSLGVSMLDLFRTGLMRRQLSVLSDTSFISVFIIALSSKLSRRPPGHGVYWSRYRKRGLDSGHFSACACQKSL